MIIFLSRLRKLTVIETKNDISCKHAAMQYIKHYKTFGSHAKTEDVCKDITPTIQQNEGKDNMDKIKKEIRKISNPCFS